MSAIRLVAGGLLFAFLFWLWFVIVGGRPLGGRAITDDVMAACEAHDLSARTRASLGCT